MLISHRVLHGLVHFFHCMRSRWLGQQSTQFGERRFVGFGYGDLTVWQGQKCHFVAWLQLQQGPNVLGQRDL
jgi:hypothetical protein